MACLAWGLLALAVLLLAGQVMAARADLFVTIANPRPLDEERIEVTVLLWGLTFRSAQPFVASAADWGFADFRVVATTRQALIGIATLGLVRPLAVVIRPHAGVLPLGEA